MRRSQFAQITRRMAQRFDLNGSARPCAVRGMNCAMPSAPWETSVARAAVWRYVRPCCSARFDGDLYCIHHIADPQCCRRLCVTPRAQVDSDRGINPITVKCTQSRQSPVLVGASEASCIRPRPRRGLLQACGSRPRHPLCACPSSVEHRSLLGVDYPTARPVRWASRTPARSIADARLAGIVAVRSARNRAKVRSSSEPASLLPVETRQVTVAIGRHSVTGRDPSANATATPPTTAIKEAFFGEAFRGERWD